MVGFDKKAVSKNRIQIEEDDLDDLDVDIKTDLSDDDLPKKQSSGNPKSSNKKTNGNANKSNGNSPNKGVKRPIKKPNEKEENMKKYIIGGVASLVIIGSISFLVFKSKGPELPPMPEIPVVQENVDKVNAGIPTLSGVGRENNDSVMTSPDLILKDLNGNEVPPDYKVLSNDEVTDFISYTKYRTTLGDGVEFYWLEAQYKNQPYKVQVPYSVYSKLDRTGITVVDIEVLTLEGGSKLATYMRVRKDAKALLDKNR